MYLRDFDSVVSRRREIASLYDDLLGQCDALELPPAPDTGDHFDAYQNYEIQADDRDVLRASLSENGIGTLIQWGGRGIHQFPKLELERRLPNADRFFDRCLMLPMNMSISDEDVKYVAEKVLAFYD